MIETVFRQFGSVAITWWLVIVGYCLLLIPTVFDLARFFWMRGIFDYGALPLAAAIWIFFQKREEIFPSRATGMPIFGFVVLVIGLVAYVIGRSQNVMFLEASAVIPATFACLLLYGGKASVARAWIPLTLLLFFPPHPGFVVDGVTNYLKEEVSLVVEGLLYGLGYPIGRNGVVLTVGPYQLLVADACSGLNSIFSLITVGFIYLYMARRSSPWHNLLLVASILPVAVLTNVLRVLVLVLVTYHFGHDAGQGFVHTFAHVLLFVGAVALLYVIDALLCAYFVRDRSKATAGT